MNLLAVAVRNLAVRRDITGRTPGKVASGHESRLAQDILTITSLGSLQMANLL
jgi:hypothetical protein